MSRERELAEIRRAAAALALRVRQSPRAWWQPTALSHIAADERAGRAWCCACGPCLVARKSVRRVAWIIGWIGLPSCIVVRIAHRRHARRGRRAIARCARAAAVRLVERREAAARAHTTG